MKRQFLLSREEKKKAIWYLTSPKCFMKIKHKRKIQECYKELWCHQEKWGDAYKFIPWYLQLKCYEIQYFRLNWSATLKTFLQGQYILNLSSELLWRWMFSPYKKIHRDRNNIAKKGEQKGPDLPTKCSFQHYCSAAFECCL